MNVVKEQSAIYAERRKRLSSALGGEPIYLSGHTALPRNFAANVYRFRQDSTFLFFSGVSQPGCGLRIDEGGRSTLYVPPADPSDALWHGEQPTFEDLGKRSGVDDVRPVSEAQSRGCHRLPVADPTVLTETPSERLVEAVIQLRMCRDETEVAAIRSALRVTGEAHRWAMAATRPGLHDHEIEALIEYVFSLRGMGLAYPSIVTKRGEVLHGHAEGLELRVGDLLLVEGRIIIRGSGYRTWSGCNIIAGGGLLQLGGRIIMYIIGGLFQSGGRFIVKGGGFTGLVIIRLFSGSGIIQFIQTISMVMVKKT